MNELIETCPFCYAECAVPHLSQDMESWPVICHSCDMMFEANQKQSAASENNELSLPQIYEPYICPSCHYQMQIAKADSGRLRAAKVSLSCPNCRADVTLSKNPRDQSLLTVALITIIFVAITASLWLVLTPEGEEMRRWLHPYLKAPSYLIAELKLAFDDLLSFIRGLFLQL